MANRSASVGTHNFYSNATVALSVIDERILNANVNQCTKLPAENYEQNTRVECQADLYYKDHEFRAREVVAILEVPNPNYIVPNWSSNVETGEERHASWHAVDQGLPRGEFIIPDYSPEGNGFTYTGAAANGGSHNAPNGDGTSNFPLGGAWYAHAPEVNTAHGGSNTNDFTVGDNWFISTGGGNVRACNVVRGLGKTADEVCTIDMSYHPNAGARNARKVARLIINPSWLTDAGEAQRSNSVQYRETWNTEWVKEIPAGAALVRDFGQELSTGTFFNANTVALTAENDNISGYNAESQCRELTAPADDPRTNRECAAVMYYTDGVELKMRKVFAVIDVANPNYIEPDYASTFNTGDELHESWYATNTGVPQDFMIPDTGGSGHNYTGTKANGGSHNSSKGDGQSNWPLSGWYAAINDTATAHGGTKSDNSGYTPTGDNWYIHTGGGHINTCDITNRRDRTATESCEASLSFPGNATENRITVGRKIINSEWLRTNGDQQRNVDNILFYEEDDVNNADRVLKAIPDGAVLLRSNSDNPNAQYALHRHAAVLSVDSGNIRNTWSAQCTAVVRDSWRKTGSHSCTAMLVYPEGNQLKARNVIATIAYDNPNHDAAAEASYYGSNAAYGRLPGSGTVLPDSWAAAGDRFVNNGAGIPEGFIIPDANSDGETTWPIDNKWYAHSHHTNMDNGGLAGNGDIRWLNDRSVIYTGNYPNDCSLQEYDVTSKYAVEHCRVYINNAGRRFGPRLIGRNVINLAYMHRFGGEQRSDNLRYRELTDGTDVFKNLLDNSVLMTRVIESDPDSTEFLLSNTLPLVMPTGRVSNATNCEIPTVPASQEYVEEVCDATLYAMDSNREFVARHVKAVARSTNPGYGVHGTAEWTDNSNGVSRCTEVTSHSGNGLAGTCNGNAIGSERPTLSFWSELLNSAATVFHNEEWTALNDPFVNMHVDSQGLVLGNLVDALENGQNEYFTGTQGKRVDFKGSTTFPIETTDGTIIFADASSVRDGVAAWQQSSSSPWNDVCTELSAPENGGAAASCNDGSVTVDSERSSVTYWTAEFEKGPTKVTYDEVDILHH